MWSKHASIGGGFANFRISNPAHATIASAISNGTEFGFAVANFTSKEDSMSGFYEIATPRDKLTITQWITDATPTVKRINAAGTAYETITGGAITTFLAAIKFTKIFIDSASPTKVIYFQDYGT